MAVPIPDFGSLAGQQKTSDDFATNQQNLANRPNQTNPFGSTTWSQGPDGTWQQTNSFNAQGQGLFDASLGAQRSIMGQIGGGAPQATFGAQQNVIDAWNRLQQPTLDQRAEAQRARASAMGLTLGSEPNNSIERGIGSTYREANDTAIGKGVDAWNQLYDRQLAGFNANRGALSDVSGVMQNMNPNKWNTSVPASATFSPETKYGAALDTFNAQRQNENADIARRQANIQGFTSALQSAGGYQGVKSMGGDAYSGLKKLYDNWGKESGTSSDGVPEYLNPNTGGYTGGGTSEGVPSLLDPNAAPYTDPNSFPGEDMYNGWDTGPTDSDWFSGAFNWA